jgi:hypothetical protein
MRGLEEHIHVIKCNCTVHILVDVEINGLQKRLKLDSLNLETQDDVMFMSIYIIPMQDIWNHRLKEMTWMGQTLGQCCKV